MLCCNYEKDSNNKEMLELTQYEHDIRDLKKKVYLYNVVEVRLLSI